MSADDWRARGRSALERLVRASAFERILISTAALVLSMFVGVLLILAAGRMTTCTTAATTFFGVGFCYDPFAVYDSLFLGALGDPINPLFRPLEGQIRPPFREGWSPLNSQMAVTLRETTVLIFTGLGVALAFRAGIFNIGMQGQLVVGALATALTVLWASSLVSGVLGTLVLVPFGLVVGALAGGLFAAIPGALKAYADANEVITTIMLNFVATSVALYLVANPFKDPQSAANETVALPNYASIPPILFDPRDSFSLVALGIALALVVASYYLLEHTSFGYDIRTSGIQPEAAEYGGVDAAKTIVSSMTLSGAVGGVGGAMYVIMILGNYQTGVPAYGFDGITVSILAGNNPLGVGFAALLFGILKSGSIIVDVSTDVPPQLVGVLRGLIILFVAMPEFFRLLGRKFVVDDREPQAVATDGGVDADESAATPGGGSDE
ncbi:nucleoside ABC transporter membrane protein [Halogranum amylolyticum]|uniref:Nucleoside ABC transporter membrane protein n=1 Tax=Halogranum amylolyticum TaxID=660520 RepID=A0A1H8SJB9_9EURY|nr:ABC transporter permease [Halogranum amylolyticum]SEO78378.1 nucleoside ABC transporter membrane protein [Halogranum amylolyticum]